MEQAQLDARRTALDDVTTAAAGDLVGYFGTIAGESPEQVAAQLRVATPAVIVEYGAIAGTQAADWYESNRPKPGFRAQLASPSIADSTQSMLSWAVSPLFTDNGADTVTRLVGGIQLLVALFDRDTIRLNAIRDPLAGRMKRVAQPGACAFCIYMSLYSDNIDAKTADYHDHCHCVPAPLWQGDELPHGEHEDAWVDAAESAHDAITADYFAKRKLAPDLRRNNFYRKFPETAINTKNIVARMREQLGTH